ncbi:MAG: alpha-1,2-fucosyltransferase [Bacteroidales bacterium]|nr:alpha-1,2-fucosyltransferase [Bacteroidales bacterium]
MKRIIVRLEGGLGNQLFQYAHALKLQKHYGGIVIFDQHAYTKKQIRSCSLKNYKLNDITRFNLSIFDRAIVFFSIVFTRFVNKKGLISTIERYQKFSRYGFFYQYQVRAFESLTPSDTYYKYIVGNWLSGVFFKDAEADVRKALVCRIKLSDKCSFMAEQIRSSESVCVHIRLGDYLAPQWKDKLYVCTPQYYQQAIKQIKERVENPHFYVFSNRHKDFEMIVNEYGLGDVTYVDMGNSDVEDMELMRLCKHFIMSNSTYSWWAQYLSDNPNKVVIAPDHFNNYPEWDMTDIYLDNWINIDV